MRSLIIFDTKNIRGDIADGEPWFAIADVCGVLGIRDVKQASDRLKDKYKRVLALSNKGRGKQQIACINKIGCYRLIMRSNSPVAEAFQDEIYDYVIPAYLDKGAVINPRITSVQLEAHKREIAQLQLRCLAAETHTKARNKAVTALARALRRNAGMDITWDSELDIIALNGRPI